MKTSPTRQFKLLSIASAAMVVGLSEVALNINNELEDVGSAFGKLRTDGSIKPL